MSKLHSIITVVFKYLKEKYFSWYLRRSAIKWGAYYHMKENGNILECDGVKAKFFLPYYTSDYLQKEIVASRNYYEYEALRYITIVVGKGIVGEKIKGNIVLDIGTNIGNHTLFFALECSAGMVHCFEPVIETFHILEKNIEINGLKNRTKLHNVGVGAQSSQATIKYFNNCNTGSTQIGYSKDGDISIVAIDDLIFESTVAFVKIDVEGFEKEVFKGMMNTVKNHMPYIMAEIRNEYFDEIYKMLSPIGYWYIPLGPINFLFIPSKL